MGVFWNVVMCSLTHTLTNVAKHVIDFMVLHRIIYPTIFALDATRTPNLTS
jgi:hypothetical protein